MIYNMFLHDRAIRNMLSFPMSLFSNAMRASVNSRILGCRTVARMRILTR